MENKCLLCGKKENVIKFYYGFWKSEYEPEKWCYLCDKCIRRFLVASSMASSTGKKDKLIELENDIIRVKK